MLHQLILRILTGVIILTCAIGILPGQIVSPTADKSSGLVSQGNGPQRPSGPGPNGPPQPFLEAKRIAQPKDDAELAAAIKQLAGELASTGRFSGSVLLAVDGKPIVDSAWGDADRSQKVANTSEIAYDVGSVGKLFTQIAILQLMDAGKLKLDDPFGKYVTSYPNQEVAEKVTIRQLLLHTSGMGDFLEAITPKTDLSSLRQLKDFLPLFADKPLEFPPGSQPHYSNSGYVVLGLVIEAVSGEDYYEYVAGHILKPADMVHSGFFDRTHLPATVAHSYDNGRDVTNMHPVVGSPAGGLQASAGDILRLVQAVDRGKLLTKPSVKVLRDLVPRPPTAPPPADETKLEAYGIAGGGPGVSAQLSVDPAGHYTRIVLCNGKPPMAMSMVATINEWIKQMAK